MENNFCVFLDVDNTILDFSKAEYTAVKATFEQFNIRNDDEIIKRYSQINTKYWELLEKGMITRDEVLSERFNEVLKEFGYPENGFELQKVYEERLRIGHWFMNGAEELLETLDGKYRLFLASNGTAKVQESRLDSSGIRHYFEGVFISEYIGAEKPSKDFFETAFESIPNFSKSSSVIVGDSLSSDILGGINAGIKTCWFNFSRKIPRDDIIPDYTIYELSELPAILRNLACY